MQAIGIVRVSVVLVLVGFIVGLSQTTIAGAGCVLHPGTPDVYEGDGSQNFCDGNDDFDSFYGFARGIISGATGAETSFVVPMEMTS